MIKTGLSRLASWPSALFWILFRDPPNASWGEVCFPYVPSVHPAAANATFSFCCWFECIPVSKMVDYLHFCINGHFVGHSVFNIVSSAVLKIRVQRTYHLNCLVFLDLRQGVGFRALVTPCLVFKESPCLFPSWHLPIYIPAPRVEGFLSPCSWQSLIFVDLLEDKSLSVILADTSVSFLICISQSLGMQSIFSCTL